MTEEKSNLRKPRSAYRKTNGFTDSVSLRVQGLSPTVRAASSSSSGVDVKSIEERTVRDSVEKHRFVEDMLELKGTYCPGLAAMEEANEAPETDANLKSHISELQKKHRDEIQQLYELQARHYLDESMDRYVSEDDSDAFPDVKRFYDTLRKPYTPTIEAYSSTVDAHRYANLSTILPLIGQHKDRIAEEAEAQRRRDAQFPGSTYEYRAIRNKDVQLRVARFLMADKVAKERMLSEFGWAWRQVKNLEDEYLSNEEFKTEVHDHVHELEARDPRRKPSLKT